MNKDAIKPKFFHVQEEFYEQLINGFREDAKQQAAKAKSMPVKMVSKQATYFKRTTMPLIMKSIQRQKLLEDFYVEAAQQRKKSVIEELRGKFLKGQQEVQQVQQEIQVQEKKAERRGFLGKMLKIARNYDRVMTAISIYKRSREQATKTEVFLGLDKKYSWLQNPEYRKQMQKKMYAAVNDEGGLLTSTMTNVMTPIMGGMFQMIDQKIGGLWRSMLMMIVEKFLLPDWDDPIDVALWAVQMGLTALSFVLTATGIGAPAGAAIGATVWAARLAKVMKIFKSIKGMSTVFKQGRRVRRIGRAWARGSRLGRATVRLSQWGRSGLIDGFARIRTLRRQYKSYMNGTYDIIFGIAKGDVQQMRDGYRAKTSRWGEDVLRSVGSKLNGVASDVSFIQERIRDAGSKLVQGIRSLHASGGIYKPLEKIYGATLTLEFAFDFQYPSVFNKLTEWVNKHLIAQVRKIQFPRFDVTTLIHLNRVFDSTYKKVQHRQTGKTLTKRGDLYYFEDSKTQLILGNGELTLKGKSLKDKIESTGFSKIYLSLGKFQIHTLGAELVTTIQGRTWFDVFKRYATESELADFKRYMTENARQRGWDTIPERDSDGNPINVFVNREYYIVSKDGMTATVDGVYLSEIMNYLHEYGALFLFKRGVLSQSQYNLFKTDRQKITKLLEVHLQEGAGGGRNGSQRNYQAGASVHSGVMQAHQITHVYEHGLHKGVRLYFSSDGIPKDMKHQIFIKGKFYANPLTKWEYKNFTLLQSMHNGHVIKTVDNYMYVLPTNIITSCYDLRGNQVTLLTHKDNILKQEKENNKQIDVFKSYVQVLVKNHMTSLQVEQRRKEEANAR